MERRARSGRLVAAMLLADPCTGPTIRTGTTARIRTIIGGTEGCGEQDSPIRDGLSPGGCVARRHRHAEPCLGRRVGRRSRRHRRRPLLGAALSLSVSLLGAVAVLLVAGRTRTQGDGGGVSHD